MPEQRGDGRSPRVGISAEMPSQGLPDLPERLGAPLILIAEDHADTGTMYEQFLQLLGYASIRTTDGDTAVRLARELTPALVLADLILPTTDGIALCRALRSSPSSAHIRVIVITGECRREWTDQAVAAGADAVLTKPCSLDQLAELIHGMLGPGLQPAGTFESSPAS